MIKQRFSSLDNYTKNCIIRIRVRRGEIVDRLIHRQRFENKSFIITNCQKNLSIREDT
jgi:hypothetical protein